MNPFIEQALYTILLPAVVSGILYLVFRLFLPTFAAAIAVAVGYIAAHIAIQGVPRFPPSSVVHFLPFFAVGSLVWAGLESLWRSNAAARWSIRALFLLALEFLLFQRIMQNRWEVWESVLWFSLTTLVLLFVWHWLEGLISDVAKNETPKPAESPRVLSASFLTIALIVLTTGSSVMLGLSANASAAQLGGALASALGALMVLSWVMKVSIGRSLIALYTLVQGGLWISGAAFASVPLLSALLMPLAVLVLFLVSSKLTLASNLLRLALFSLPVIASAGFAFWMSLLRYGEY
jgi:hypothetical protein